MQEMAALVRATAADHLHVVDLPYRFSSWAFDDPGNVGLWAAPGGPLLAWAVMQTPFWTVDYACHPDAARDLRREIWAWADERARALLATRFGRPAWFVNVLAGDSRDLEEAGFACQAGTGEESWSKVLLERPAEGSLGKPVVPAGFTVRPLAGPTEVEAYVALHRAAFESENMTVDWRARTLRRPEYVPDLDLVAVGPDGRLAAFCVCWLDGGSLEPRGQVEPMGVGPEWRGLGLGRALLCEGLRRLSLHVARRICVETDNYRNAALRLYESCGFRVLRDVLVYRKAS